MKKAPCVALAALAVLFLLSACGKVGSPLPPIIRIPQKIENLSAVQSGYAISLNWTNPSKYIDNNPATDLGMVHVLRNSVEIGVVAATAAGKPQSFSVDVRKSVGSPLTFTIQLVVPKAEKPSPISNAVSITPVAVPGSPRNLQAIVDKGEIALTWDPPERDPALAEAYLVQRSDRPAPQLVRTPHFEDAEYEPGKTYTYTVTAVRGTNSQIAGDGNVSAKFAATDTQPPATPSGLQVELIGNSVFLIWEKNTERDLKGYKLYRSDRTEPIYTGNANGYPDPDYVSGKGISYQVLAEDRSGNPSQRSAPTPGP